MDISSSRNAGKVDVNRDYLGMLEDGGCGCFAVCDGSPGSAGTDEGSSIVIDSMMTDFKNTSDVTRENYFGILQKCGREALGFDPAAMGISVVQSLCRPGAH